MWRSFSKYCFSQQSFKSSFQIRSKLSEFFKHTHPDTNLHAPETIKQENLRSLKNLNAYIDSLLHSKPIEAKLLKFYVAQKSNMKSKKYFAFEVELPEVKSTANEGANNKILGNVIDVLNAKFLETRMLKNPLLRKQISRERADRQTPKQTQQERLKRMESELKPYKQRRRSMPQQFQQLMNEKIKASQKNAGRQSLLGELQKKVLLANTPTNKPLLWSRIASKNSGIYSNYEETLSKIIDPNLIYLSQKLSSEQVEQQVKGRMLPGQDQLLLQASQKHTKMHKIFLEMEQSQPPVFLYITDHYSAKQIPGFFSIPFNFRPEDFIKQYNLHIGDLLSERQKYQRYYDNVKDLTEQLNKENNIEIQFEQFSNNADISRKLLMLKRLRHYKVENPILLVPFGETDYKYFCKEYNLSEEKTCHLVGGKIVLRIEFSDVDIKEVFEQLV